MRVKTVLTRCRTCVYPTTKPDLLFEDGQCAACRTYDRRNAIDWPQRFSELLALRSYAKKNRHGFDCIVPSSGGKDSTFQVVTLMEAGFTPLVVTASTCYLTELGRRNIDNLRLIAKTLEIDPDYAVRRELNVLGQEMVGDISWPEHAAIFSVPYRVALENDIGLIFYGENPQNEYGGPIDSEAAAQMTKRWVSEFGGLLGLRPQDFIGLHGITQVDMDYYMLPSESDLERVQAFFLGQFIPWDAQRNATVAIQNGLRFDLPSDANWWPWENLDNAMTGLHDHGMYRKYGYGRLAGQVSVDVRRDRMDRPTAMELVRKFDGLFPEVYAGVPLDNILDRIGKRRDWLFDTLDFHTSWDIFSERSQQMGDLRPILWEFSEEAAEA